tara:strand:- start:4391 stop:4615 length:225 start_codon:yes stop_codon:yes gene_type:complete
MKVFPNKRKESQRSAQDLFKSKDLKKIMKKEKRKEELDKIRKVQEQDKTYYYTLTSCIFVILVLTCLALFGGYQ